MVVNRKINTLFRDSSLFMNAEDSKLRPNVILSVIIFFALWGGSLMVGRFVVIPIIELLPSNTMIWLSVCLSLRKILICGIQIAAFFAWVKFAEKRKITTIGFTSKHKAICYWSGVFLGVGSVSAIVFVSATFGIIEVSFNGISPITLLVSSLFIAAFGWAIQSASEEIAIRGWLIPTLGIRYSPILAVLLTGKYLE
jgi:membrane protease YdiL (CAAX protease family)